MPLPTKPTDHTEFDLNQTNTAEPAASLKTDGYVFGDAPASQNFNWILNNSYLWEDYFDDLLDILLSIVFLDDANNRLGVGDFTGTTPDNILHARTEDANGALDANSTDNIVAEAESPVIRFKASGLSVGDVTSTLAFGDDSLDAGRIYYEHKLAGVDRDRLILVNNENYFVTLAKNTMSLALKDITLADTEEFNGVIPQLKIRTNTADSNNYDLGGIRVGQGGVTIAEDHFDGIGVVGVNFYTSTTESIYKQSAPDSLSSSVRRIAGFKFKQGQITAFTQSGTPTAQGTTASYTSGPYVAAGGTSWTSSSDERIKTIVSNIENSVDKLSNLRTVNAFFNTDDDQREHPVLIAQDIAQEFPNTAIFPEDYNENLTPEDEGFQAIGVNYQELIPVLVAAIKEQSEQITALEARVTALENG